MMRGVFARRFLLPKRSMVSHQPGCCWYGRSWNVWENIRTVEVWGLENKKDSNEAVLIHKLAWSGGYVESGEPVALLEDPSDGTRTVLSAPFNGSVTKFHVDVGETVKVGDSLFDMDIDLQVNIHQEDHDFVIQQLGDENKDSTIEPGTEFQAWIQTLLETCDDANRLRSLARFLDRKYPKNPHISEICTQILSQAFKYGMSSNEEGTTTTPENLEENDPNDIQVQIHHLIQLGMQHANTGDMEAAYEVFFRAYELQKQQMQDDDDDSEPSSSPHHQGIAASLNNLGSIRYNQGRFEDAIAYYREALPMMINIHGESHVETAGCYQNLGLAFRSIDLQQAFENTQKALQIRVKVLGSNHIDVAESHVTLANLLAENHDFVAALEQFAAALEIQTAQLSENSRTTAMTRVSMGAAYNHIQKCDDALEQFQLALTSLEKNDPIDEAVATTYNQIGLALYAQQKYSEAREKLEKAQEILVQLCGDTTHPLLPPIIASIASTLKAERRLDEALVKYSESHRLLETVLGTTNHPDIGFSYNNMAQVFALQRRFEDAITVYDAALEVLRLFFGTQENEKENHPHFGTVHFNKGWVYRETGDAERAKAEFTLAYEIWENTLGPDHPQTQEAEQQITQ
jgi:tetratricopeptide (TPR) repeat protein